MTEYDDTATIGTRGVITAVEAAQYIDSHTCAAVSSVSAVEVSNYEEATVGTNTTAITTADVAAFIDAGEVDCLATVVGQFVEVYSIATFDYNWSTWDTTYTYDSVTYPGVGCQGPQDNDNGIL